MEWPVDQVSKPAYQGDGYGFGVSAQPNGKPPRYGAVNREKRDISMSGGRIRFLNVLEGVLCFVKT
jgi:hypothetical protein